MEGKNKTTDKKIVFITSPLPGKLIKIMVKEGNLVKDGQIIAYLESMKMKSEILSMCEGEIGKILIKEGSNVKEGETLFEIWCREVTY